MSTVGRVVFVLIGCCSMAAAAQPAGVQQGESSESPRVAESPRTASAEFKMGGYKPMINRESTVRGNPYDQTFGASAMLLAELEVDKMLYQGIGLVSVGVSVGYAEKYAAAFLVQSDPNAPPVRSNDNTSLKVVPIKLLAIYKFDYLALHRNIPFTPYVKVGLVFEPWWSTKSGNIQYPVSGGRSAGARWGYGFTGGLALLLDFFEPRLAKDFDTDLGVNHTYLFAEYTYENVNSFGRAGIDLSSRHWMFGLAFEF